MPEPTLRPTPYLMLFEGRSGSTHLTELLNSHPNIQARKELFSASHEHDRKFGVTEAGMIRRQFYMMKRLYDEPPEVGVTAWGFKTKLRDVYDPAALAAFLDEHGIRILFPYRQNRIKVVVSIFNGMRLEQRTGDWNLYSERTRLGPFAIDPDDFAVELRKSEENDDELQAFVDRLNVPVEPIAYEDLATRTDETLASICAFLDVPVLPMHSPVRKNTRDDLREVLLNFDELQARYAGTPYESMFDEVLLPAAV